MGTFLLAIAFGLGSEVFVEKVPYLVLALLFLLFIILINILFDIIGVAVTAANEVPFHAKASNRVSGAGEAVKLIRNADKVANFCSDVVGDVTGTISGALGAAIVIDIIKVAHGLEAYEIAVSTVFLALVAGVTVTGKAWGKNIGFNRANDVVFYVGTVLSWIERTTGIQLVRTGKQRKRGKKA